MSKWTKEEIEEFWRHPKHAAGYGEVLRYVDRDRAEEMRAAALGRPGGMKLSSASADWEGLKAWLPSADTAPGALFNVDRSVAPLVVTRFDGAAADPYDPGGATLHLSMANECGREHRAYMPGSMVRLIQAPEKARADRAEAYESSELRDKCGALARENRDVLAENARLRRRIEDMERKGKKR